ncbi:DedA family protein [Lichenibacterium minor]|uniref:DedA family protein n=1 Tax=Lichenibacterium minor TaxID=2316528 RepID=UPI0013ED9D91|nr:hypothetical protein [Lichenibacterium minor]
MCRYPEKALWIAVAAYAGASHRLDLRGVIAAATIGDNLGFWIGRAVGTRLTVRYGARLRITERGLRLGRYLFVRLGGKVVLFGRFVTMLRALAGLLAGMSDMGWGGFLTLNVASRVL